MSVSIIGVGMIPVAEHWNRGLRDLAAEAGAIALDDADMKTVDALYVGNAYAATFNQQSHLGSLIADEMGLTGIEAYTCEAADASGGVALRNGILAVASGMIRSALVIGVEKATDIVGPARISARNISLDADFESVNGVILTALAALLMRRYMAESDVGLSQFEGFSVNAHRNGAMNPYAMFRNKLREGVFSQASMISEPVSLFDSAPDGDGAAAVVLVNANVAGDLVPQPIQVCASTVATDRFMLQDRDDLLLLEAVAASFSRALSLAGLTRDDISLLEIHDAYTIMTVLSLEAMGYSKRGKGWSWGKNGGSKIALSGDLPVSTFGGLKSRGNPGGATGIYQAVEAVLQLRGAAGANQVDEAEVALIQNIGGLASTVVTHILSARQS